jgi:hypothetical protein
MPCIDSPAHSAPPKPRWGLPATEATKLNLASYSVRLNESGLVLRKLKTLPQPMPFFELLV